MEEIAVRPLRKFEETAEIKELRERSDRKFDNWSAYVSSGRYDIKVAEKIYKSFGALCDEINKKYLSQLLPGEKLLRILDDNTGIELNRYILKAGMDMRSTSERFRKYYHGVRVCVGSDFELCID